MKTSAPKAEGRSALVLPDYNDAYQDALLITRTIQKLAEGLIHGASGENEDADLFAWLAEKLEACHSRLDQAVQLVSQSRADAQ